MKTNGSISLILVVFTLIFCSSCKPSLSVRSKIKHHEEALCNYPETYTSSFKWVVNDDSILTASEIFKSESEKLEESYEHVKIIYHLFSARDGNGILSKDTSITIMDNDGRLTFE